MSAGKFDFTGEFAIEQGSTFSVPLFVKDGNQVPIDLTGASARMQVRKNVSSEDVLLELTSENGRILVGTGLGDGELILGLTNVETSALTWDVGVYDLEIVFPGDMVTRLMQGKIAVSKEVTR